VWHTLLVYISLSHCLVLFAAETPENDGGDLLLSNDFLKGCLELFSVPSRGYETNSRTFPPKHLNIVDPLKENNNLGRSVSKGRSSFPLVRWGMASSSISHALTEIQVFHCCNDDEN
jgi:hypothetical protein